MSEGHLVLSGRVFVQQLDTRDNPEVLWPLFRELIERSDELWVLRLDGFQESSGIQREVALARSCNKPVSYVDPS